MNEASHPGEPKYHHGRSPAAWAGVTLAMIGFVLLGAGVLMGPNWTVFIVGGVFLILSLIATRALQVAGLGNR